MLQGGERTVVTVDGLSASGKSALARALADKLGFAHLNSGLLYRAAGFLAHKAGLRYEDGPMIAQELAQHSIVLRHDERLGAVVEIDRVPYEAELMSRAISDAASAVARHKPVRDHFLLLQRRAFEPMGVVAEGRDMGTIVFPDAPVKFFVEARLDVRAQRRCEQLRAGGHAADLPAIRQEIAERDERDSTRAVAPTKPADGAIIIDNSEATLAENASRMADIVLQRQSR